MEAGRLIVCDQPGRICIVKDEIILPMAFLEISNIAMNSSHRKALGLTSNYDERGLLGLAFNTGISNSNSLGYQKLYLN